MYFNVNRNELIEFIKNGLKITDFKIKDYYNKSNKVVLYLSRVSSYIRGKSYLALTNTKFFTYAPKWIRNKTILLNGFSGDTEPG